MELPRFLELFDANHLPVYRFALRLTGSAADAEDIVQECFLGLLKPGCSYDPNRAPLRTYLFGVAWKQFLKRTPRRPNAEPLAAPPTPEYEMFHSEMRDAVARAVTQLSEPQRAVLILACYEQMPLAEIAQTLDIEIGAVKMRLQRAREQLKASLIAYAPGGKETA
ncbi:MAG TPA: RNA polymerase sigma factor [Bryobacteraceae bacterium]|nr:RNA polymerase sigma factor [Bryobacteraceae bacterium]